MKFRGISEALKSILRARSRARKENTSSCSIGRRLSLGAAISLGGLDHPELLIDWPVVRALAERALALDETWRNGAVPELMMTVESQGDALGGSEERARRYFARAVEIQQGLSPGPYVALATGSSRAGRTATEFAGLLGQRTRDRSGQRSDHRLVTLIMQKRARLLLDHIDDLFLELDTVGELSGGQPCLASPVVDSRRRS